MALGMEVGLGPGHIAPSSPPQKGDRAPISGPFLLWPDGWMYQDTTQPDNIVLDGDPAPPPLKGQSSNFRLMSLVAKRLDGLKCHLVWM